MSAGVVDEIATEPEQTRPMPVAATAGSGADDLDVLAEEIRQAHDALLGLRRRTVQEIFALGDKLIGAKKKVRAAGKKWTEFRLPFGHDVASMYIKIAKAAHLRNPEVLRYLPDRYTLLYPLAKLTPEEFTEALPLEKQGKPLIHLDMDTNDAKRRNIRRALRYADKPAAPVDPAREQEWQRRRRTAGGLELWAMGPNGISDKDWQIVVCEQLVQAAGDDDRVRRLVAGLRELAAMLEKEISREEVNV